VSGTFFLGQWRVWQRVAITHLRGDRVLEVGMGTGNLQADLLRAGFQAFGVDFSSQMLRQSRRKARIRGVGAFNMCRARAQALPFGPAEFDSVVTTFPSDYIGEPATLGEIARVLRPGGRLVVVPGGWLHPRGARGRVLQRIARAVYEEDAAASHPSNPIEGRPKEAAWISTLAARMRDAGFDVIAHVASNDRGAAIVIIATMTA
jgi:ubiquinone/menaquinone biosynthesis C-methylase UbiE